MRMAIEPDLARIEFPDREIQVLPMVSRTLRPPLAPVGAVAMMVQRRKNELGGQRCV